MMTRRDPWVNLLRPTVAVFSAGLGGADSICVLPFTQALGLPDAFARRLARNTQLVLLEESNLGKVADPAAGSGGFEALTDALVERGYALFQADRKGRRPAEGAGKAAPFRPRWRKIADERAKNVARRKEPLTGASEFPDIHEKPVAVLLPAPPAPAADDKALAPHRIAEPFEALRDQAEAAATSARRFSSPISARSRLSPRAPLSPRIFSRPAASRPSATKGLPMRRRWPQAFTASGAKLAVLCSSDAVYAEQGVAAAKALAAAAPISMSPAVPAKWRRNGARRACATSSLSAADLLAQLREALQAA